MDYSKIENILRNNIKEFNIKLKSGDIKVTLVSQEYCNKRNWKLLYFINNNYFYEKLTNFISNINKIQIDKIELFLFSAQEIEVFDSNTSKYTSISRGVYYYKSIRLNEIEDIILYPTDSRKNDLDVYSMSMIATNDLLDFIIFVDEMREDFYFYGKQDFLYSFLEISKEDYEKYFQKIIQDTYSLLFKDYLKWLWKNCIMGRIERSNDNNNINK